MKNDKRTAPKGQRSKGRGGKIIPAFCNILGTLILLSVIISCIPLSIPRFMGYEIYRVVTGSMAPEIPVGSIIYVKQSEPGDIQEDEIIAFVRDGSVITHRVIENHTLEGEFITKGDANAEEDLSTVAYDALVGRVERHYPVLGDLLMIYGTNTGKLYAVCFAACGVMMNMLASRMRDRKRQRQPEQ